MLCNVTLITYDFVKLKCKAFKFTVVMLTRNSLTVLFQSLVLHIAILSENLFCIYTTINHIYETINSLYKIH